MKLSKQELYAEAFQLWFMTHATSQDCNLFAAGLNCTLTMNLLSNPFICGTTTYEPEWEECCDYLGILPNDETSRLALYDNVVQFGVDTLDLVAYSWYTTDKQGNSQVDTFYYRKGEFI